MSANILLVFLKNPRPGNAKTRLARKIGQRNALLIYRHLVERILEKTSPARGQYEVRLFVDEKQGLDKISRWLRPTLPPGVQRGSTLGRRMHNAFLAAFSKKYQKAIIIGTDAPRVDKNLVQKAFGKLGQSDVVIGPAMDGGYYLLGLKRPMRSLLEDVEWSTSRVLAQTLAKAIKIGLKVSFLKKLGDIDTFEDLRRERWLQYLPPKRSPA